jgi:hypothetical protein
MPLLTIAIPETLLTQNNSAREISVQYLYRQSRIVLVQIRILEWPTTYISV